MSDVTVLAMFGSWVAGVVAGAYGVAAWVRNTPSGRRAVLGIPKRQP